MKRRKNKKSGIIAAVVGLSAVSLVSVGFASWVMSGGDSLELGGEISVESVTDQRYFIYEKSSVQVNYGNNVKGAAAGGIVFGIDDSTPIANAWLTAAASNNQYENLTASVEVWVANLAASATNITATLTADAGYATAVSHNYVAALPTPVVNVTNETDYKGTVSPNQITFRKVTVGLTFAWGSKFGGQNPYKYYNTGKTVSGYVSGTSGATWGDDARSSLLQLQNDLTGVHYTLTIKTTVPNA